MDFSHFDRVLAPVIAFSRDLKPLYANAVASKLYPWLTSVGLHLFCTKASLQVARERICAGHAVVVPMGNDLHSDLVFQPVLGSFGDIEYVFVFVRNESLSADEAVVRLEAPLYQKVCDEITEPLLEFLALLDAEPFRSLPAAYGQVVARLRRRLVRASTFLSHTQDMAGRKDSSFRICEAGEVLDLCAKCFVSMKFSCAQPVYLPVSKDALIRIMTDALIFLFVRRADNSRITVSIERHERETEIRIETGCLTPVSESDRNAPLENLSFLHHRLSAVGGRVEISPRQNGSVRLSLLFPEIRLSLSDVVVGDWSENISPSSRFSLELLQDLSETDSLESEA